MELAPRFVRQLGEAFAHRLVGLEMIDCGLRELPRTLSLLVNLTTLVARDNWIHWVNYHLTDALTQLRYIDLRGNHTLPRALQRTACYRTTRVRFMRALCALDASFRRCIVTLMGVLRKRWRVARDLCTLLGQAMWEGRFEVDHPK